jgi:predicted TIM-barrel fold metal-dependent hydrolase
VNLRKDDLILISVDDHICEPADMFSAHVPAKYRDHAPRVIVEPDGTEQWYYGEIKGRHTGLNAVAGKPPEMFDMDANRFSDMRAGCYMVDERVRDMSAGGQLAGLNFPNWTGFGGQVLNQGPDPKVNEVMVKAYNDWHIDEWCGAHPERFIPCGILPYFDPDLAAKEVRRLAAKGCHAVVFSENPEALSMPSIHSGQWDPVFAACSDVGTVLCVHIGSSSRMPPTMADSPPTVMLNLTPVMSVTAFAEFLWADIWLRYPNLRVCLSEGDIGWMPYFVFRAQHVHERHFGWTGRRFPPGYDPASLFRERFICCFIDEPVGIANLASFNVDNVCWEGDFPHSDGSWPNGPESIESLMRDLSDDVVNKITHENAMRHFQFDPFSRRPKQRCTVGALREEAADVDTTTRVA